MTEAYTFWREFGFQALALVAIGWFFVRKVWPLIEKSVDRGLTIAEKDRTALIDSLARRDAELTSLNSLLNGLVLEALASTRSVILENGRVIGDHTQVIRELVAMLRVDSQRPRRVRAGDVEGLDVTEKHD